MPSTRMTPYLDSSAFAKRYLIEPGSPGVGELVVASTVAISILGRPEVASLLERAARDRRVTRRAADRLQLRFDRDWKDAFVLGFSNSLAESAALLVRRHVLAGADAVHLATALELHRELGDVRMATFDARLWVAARTEGLDVWPPDLLP